MAQSTAARDVDVLPSSEEPPRAHSASRASGGLACTAGAALVVIVSLALRATIRGPYYPGWDILLATNGAFFAATKPLSDVLRSSFVPDRPGNLSVPTYSLFNTVIPGYLQLLGPWEYWAHLVTLVLVTATFWLIAIALELPWRRRWSVLLAWAASPPLLSFALAGFPWGAVFLPHAIALVAILKPSMRRSWIATPVLCAAASVAAWQGYDLGKTVFVTFLAGALLVGDVPILTRVVWLAVGSLQLYFALTHRSGPTQAFLDAPLQSIWPVIEALQKIGLELVMPRGLDLPFLLVAAAIALWSVRRDRLFLAAQLAVQLGLVVVLAMSAPGELRPRRFLAVSYCAVVVIGAAFRADSSLWARRTIVAALVVGVVAQIHDFVAFARWPRPTIDFPMPYTYSEADYMVVRSPIDWAARMSADVLAGDTLVIVYGRFAYDENATNPTGVLERVYLHVGHDRFVRQVHVYGSMPCGFACLPLRPLSDLEDGLAQVASVAATSGRPVHLYYSQDFHLTYEHTFEAESATVFTAVRRRFALRDAEVLGPKLLAFRLVPRPRGAAEGIAVRNAVGELLRTNGANEERHRVPWTGLPFDHYWVVDEPRPPRSPAVEARPWGAEPMRIHLFGTLTLARAGRYELLLGADDTAVLRIDGEPVLSTPGGGIRIEQAFRSLAEGPHSIDVTYDDAAGTAHLLVDMRHEGNEPSRIGSPDDGSSSKTP